MKALVQGRRNASVGIVLGLFGMLCLFGVTTGLAIYGMTNLHHLRGTIYQRCLQRQAYDQANHESVAADADLYAQLLQIAQEAPRQTDPLLARLVERQEQVIRLAQQRKATAADQGVIGTCTAYK